MYVCICICIYIYVCIYIVYAIYRTIYGTTCNAVSYDLMPYFINRGWSLT